nr:immunoglobulin heavy chain junction region [Macaca mulatta]
CVKDFFGSGFDVW